jgi:putative ABC transport system permease protein
VRFGDVLKFALTALGQQKVRTLLTTLGVVFGTLVLVLSLSVGVGVQQAVTHQFSRFDRLRKVEIWASWGTPANDVPKDELIVNGRMSDAKRERIREALRQRWQRKHQSGPRVAISQERLKRWRALPHVEAVIPSIHLGGWGFYHGRGQEVYASGATPGNNDLARRLIAGRSFTAAGGRDVLVSEFALYLWGVVDDEQVRRVPGQKLRLEFRFGASSPNLLLALLNPGQASTTPEEEQVLRKAARQLPQALGKLDLKPAERQTLRRLLRRTPEARAMKEEKVSEEFTIAGVLRLPAKDDRIDPWQGAGDVDVILPLGTAERLFFRSPYVREHGVNRAVIEVDSEDHVQEVADQVKADGLMVFALVEILEKVRLNVTLISFATAFVAGVALLVACLGIINTMLMTVLERTPEIGVMKAVGARDGHIQGIFLVEGALIGLVGGSLGLLFGWLVSLPANSYAMAMMAKQTQSPIDESLFVFPVWLTLGIPLFAGLVTTLAAVYPARRAARLNPVVALRHE